MNGEPYRVTPAGVTVFMSVFACEPLRGSEPGVGFTTVMALARLAKQEGVRAIVLTRPHRLASIETALRAEGLWDYIALEPVAIPRIVWKATGRRMVRLAALLWQWKAVRRVNRLARLLEGRVVFHHVTFATDGLPTFEWKLRRSIFRVYGPAGSAQGGNVLAGRSRWSALRSRVAAKNIRGVQSAIAQNDEVGLQWRSFGVEAIVEPNVYVSESERIAALGRRRVASLQTASGNQSQVTLGANSLISVGLLEERKRHHLAIEAFVEIPHAENLVIVGDGPLEQHLRALAIARGVGERVFFAGKVTRAEALGLIAQCRVLLHPSRQEGAGAVVGEAQSLGVLPVVFAGSGSDTVVRLGEIGVIVEEHSSSALARAASPLLKDSTHAKPSPRWREDRLPDLLRSWYRL